MQGTINSAMFYNFRTDRHRLGFTATESRGQGQKVRGTTFVFLKGFSIYSYQVAYGKTPRREIYGMHHKFRAEYRPLKPHRDISRYGKCISQCVLNISYKQESQFSISYRSQNLLH